jgi:hypothetical protein
VFEQTWLNVWTVSSFMVIAQGMAADRDGFCTSKQLKKRGIQGLPFAYHGGMWADAFLFGPLVARLVEKYHHEWSVLAWILAFLLGTALSVVMHMMYIWGGRELPEAHTHDGKLTIAGWIHFMYMTLGFTIILLFYVGTDRTPLATMVVSGLLLIHVTIGIHLPLRAWVKKAKPVWYPKVEQVLLPEHTYTLVGALAAVTALALFRV